MSSEAVAQRLERLADLASNAAMRRLDRLLPARRLGGAARLLGLDAAFSPAFCLKVVSAPASAPISSVRSEHGTSTARSPLATCIIAVWIRLSGRMTRRETSQNPTAATSTAPASSASFSDQVPLRRRHLAERVLLAGLERRLGERDRGGDPRHRLLGPFAGRERRRLARRERGERLVPPWQVNSGVKYSVLTSSIAAVSSGVNAAPLRSFRSTPRPLRRRPTQVAVALHRPP